MWRLFFFQNTFFEFFPFHKKAKGYNLCHLESSSTLSAKIQGSIFLINFLFLLFVLLLCLEVFVRLPHSLLFWSHTDVQWNSSFEAPVSTGFSYLYGGFPAHFSHTSCCLTAHTCSCPCIRHNHPPPHFTGAKKTSLFRYIFFRQTDFLRENVLIVYFLHASVTIERVELRSFFRFFRKN